MSTERRIGPARERDRLADAREGERALAAVRDARAARMVAGRADNAEECSLLLEMLGIEPVAQRR
ncbi:hypothetical protein [Saccharothrix algeriensis]|uniref:Uncharacterized protein n=1 Tax=Saccharothrix algeriensis TaxID=173560 RepID=A0A8T8HUR5_9PSEU|nr:hypothetical protein [Saccharothrix algeriensis]MBM7813612.1 hypothetical protein [Saccharothrix algeriensis]QTR02099.1 hypothetical protein J7S33_23160 [Saccharothrix algeriensis]